MTRKVLGSLTAAVAACSLALLPSSATAGGLGSISGASPNRCHTVTGDYSWSYAGHFDGRSAYTTNGTAYIHRKSTCTVAPVFLVSGSFWTGHTQGWITMDRREWPISGNEVDLSMDGHKTRDLRFHICNLNPDGTIGGCGKVS